MTSSPENKNQNAETFSMLTNFATAALIERPTTTALDTVIATLLSSQAICEPQFPKDTGTT